MHRPQTLNKICDRAVFQYASVFSQSLNAPFQSTLSVLCRRAQSRYNAREDRFWRALIAEIIVRPILKHISTRCYLFERLRKWK